MYLLKFQHSNSSIYFLYPEINISKLGVTVDISFSCPK